MPIKTLVPTQDQIAELRDLFQQKYATSQQTVQFHHVDIDRITNDDIWLTRFLEMYDLDMKVSFEKLWETCVWRKEYGAYDLDETNLRMDYLRDGTVFAHNKDVDGKPLLIFKTKLHTKGTKDMDEVIRVVVYWIERIQREFSMEMITVVFDMAGTGLSNMDLDFIKRIIETFKLYYPNCLNYILVYEMAWILNAAFKIVRSLLPAKALEILKMITKKDINTYIDKDNCFVSWGGNDKYEFEFVPEVRKAATTSAASASATAPKVSESMPMAPHDPNSSHHDKKVHFANSSPVREAQMHDLKDHHAGTPSDQKMLKLLPNDTITFSTDDGKECIVEMTSISKIPVTFKIQTTSPEKFRVRPRCGILNADEKVSVSIVLKPEHRLQDGAKDKFLVMCMPVPPGTGTDAQQLADVWKQKASNIQDVEQHRLCCVYKGAHDPWNGAAGEVVDSKSTGSMNDLLHHAKKMEKQLRNTQILQYMTLLLVAILAAGVVYLLHLHLCGGAEEGELTKSVPSDQEKRAAGDCQLSPQAQRRRL